jgi:hypothetical protein
MPRLENIRRNIERRDEYVENKSKSYENPSSIKMISEVIKLQNILVIHWLCDRMNVSEYDQQVIYDKYIKVNYYCPDIVSKNRFNKKYLEKK